MRARGGAATERRAVCWALRLSTQVIAAVLLLGQVAFEPGPASGGDETAQALRRARTGTSTGTGTAGTGTGTFTQHQIVRGAHGGAHLHMHPVPYLFAREAAPGGTARVPTLVYPRL